MAKTPSLGAKTRAPSKHARSKQTIPPSRIEDRPVFEGWRDQSGRAGRCGTLTTSQGVPVADDQTSLKQGARGPALLEDFHFREQIFHFDRKASLAGSWGMALAKKGDAKAFIAALTPLRFGAREPLVDQDALPA